MAQASQGVSRKPALSTGGPANGPAAGAALSRFLAPYYILNAVALSSFLAVRLLVLHSAGGDGRSTAFERWDRHSLLALVFTTLFKLRRAPTLEAGVAGALFYSQLLVVSLAFYIDRRVCAWYLLLFAVLHLACPQPGRGDQGEVKRLTQRQLEVIVAEGVKTPAWLVEVYAAWSPQCTQLAPLFVELSRSYSSPLLQFGRLDVARFPEFPEAHFVDTSVFSQQLPTYMLIQGGKELLRIPRLYGPSLPMSNLRRAELVRAFDLDRWLLASLQARKGSKDPKGKA